MNKYLLLSLFILSLCLQSCSSNKTLTLTPEQFKRVSTNVFEEDFDLVYKAALSLLTNKQFIIAHTDKESGVISAERRTNGKVGFWSELLENEVQRNYLTRASVLITRIDEKRTEVRILLYMSKTAYYEQRPQAEYSEDNSSLVNFLNIMLSSNHSSPVTSGDTITRPQTYYEWFEILKEEIKNIKEKYQ